MRATDDRCPAVLAAGVNDLIDKVDELLRKSNRDLLAHPAPVLMAVASGKER